jgi:SAM-dependent methyltransferase
MFLYEGRVYDAKYGDYVVDQDFWKRQAAWCGGPILELACGTGRVAIALAREGHKVTGLDLSAGMLAEARRKAGAAGLEIDWVQADCRDFSLGRKFPLVFIAFNSLTHLLTLSDLERCLACVRRHMDGGSRFIIDIFNPSLKIILRDPATRYPHATYQDPDGRGTVEITENNHYDAASQINTIHLYYHMPDGTERTDDLVLRMFFPQELDALLKYNGLKIEAKYGDFDESPFVSDSPKQLVVARLA